jgi:pectin methylesterase-like acyl-CoA thioesterase
MSFKEIIWHYYKCIITALIVIAFLNPTQSDSSLFNVSDKSNVKNDQLPFICCLPRENQKTPYDSLVAKHGGEYESVQDAVDAAPNTSDATTQHWRIFIQEGWYNEYITINNSCLQIVGAGSDKTLITGTITIYSQSVDIMNMTIENTELYSMYSSGGVALDSEGANFRAYNSQFNGFITALQAGIDEYTFSDNTPRPQQLYYNCSFRSFVYIVTGNAEAYFYKCVIESLDRGTIALNYYKFKQSRSGFLFDRCHITATQDNNKIYTYLGQTSSEHFSKVIYSNCYLQSNIRRIGWLAGKFNKGYEFAEYRNYGPGANISKRLNTSIQLTSSMRRALRGFANTNEWQGCTLD